MLSPRFLAFCILLLLVFWLGAVTVHNTWFPYTFYLDIQESIKNKQEKESPQPFRSYPYYERKVSQQNYFADKYVDALFLGDSLTDEMDWQVMLPEKLILNFGINGDTTAGVLNRLDTVQAVQADTLFLMIGINDLFRGKSVKGILERYQLIVETLQPSVTTLYIQSLLPVNYRKFDLGAQIIEINRSLEQIASEYPNVVFLDIYSKMVDGGALNERYTNDGVHLTAAGYSEWLDVVSALVNRD